MKRIRGFTIVELMISLSLMAILAAIAVPSYERLILTSAADKFRDDLYSTLVLARSEALTRGTSVTVCTSTDTNVCSDDADDWQGGWLMFEDKNNDSTLDLTSEEILSVYQNFNQRSASLTFNNGDKVRFSRLGGAAGFNGTFNFCRSDADYAQYIVLQNSGRARFADVHPPSGSGCP